MPHQEIPHIWGALRHHNLLTYSCPQCPRWFKNRSGLMQHLNSMHREVSPPDNPANHLHHDGGEYDTEQPQVVPPTPSSPSRCSSTPSHDVNAEFIGPGEKVYRNYHPRLSGEYVIVNTCFVY
jgi:hypothetical protein